MSQTKQVVWRHICLRKLLQNNGKRKLPSCVERLLFARSQAGGSAFDFTHLLRLSSVKVHQFTSLPRSAAATLPNRKQFVWMLFTCWAAAKCSFDWFWFLSDPVCSANSQRSLKTNCHEPPLSPLSADWRQNEGRSNHSTSAHPSFKLRVRMERNHNSCSVLPRKGLCVYVWVYELHSVQLCFFATPSSITHISNPIFIPV